MEKLLFGAAYYEEYMPCERLDEDIALMKKAGINTVRIAESTWSTCEPQEGVFDFSHVEKVLDKMEEAGIGVIVGTPTYAIPAWMVKSYPEVLATTIKGQGIYGPRQIMDITNPVYLYYGERIIRELMKHVADRKCVIGYQLDNETKYYGTAGKNVQERFVKYLRRKFHDDLNAMNAEFGLDYWSNRIGAWEDFPDVRGTINGSLGAEFEKFQRTLVEEFLGWQAGIVNEYRKAHQFITHNLDFAWKGYSWGVQPDIDQYKTAKHLTIAGADIYHPTQDELTGIEIAFGGDLIRSLKQDNYLILETQAQGFPGWTPYKGQLRLQAYSHIASGANSVMYWHWHSIHNAVESYWKGLLSHDFQENETYLEACRIGKEFSEIGSHLVNLKKQNDVAVLISNEALTALKWFGIDAMASDNGQVSYNDVVRWMYDALYKMNVECDFVWPESENLSRYKMIVVPALYAADDKLLNRLSQYVQDGGVLVTTFKSGFANENVKISHEIQPHILTKCLGVKYHQFTFPKNVLLSGELIGSEPQSIKAGDMDAAGKGDIHIHSGKEAKVFMELLIPTGADSLAVYDHYNWKGYSAVTRNCYGKGKAYYIGCMTDEEVLTEIFHRALTDAGISYEKESRFPVIIRKGKNDFGKMVWFYLNYSEKEQKIFHAFQEGTNLLTGNKVKKGDSIVLSAWDLVIIEENKLC